MEEESVISVNSTSVTSEASDSRSNNRIQLHNSSTRPDAILSTSKFKGVISQANGHWGAQIYVNHQRIWLGTFKSETEAAMAYDSAALKLRNGESSHRNVQWSNITVEEPKFQSQFSTETVLNMIKDGSYPFKFADYLRAQHFPDLHTLPNAHSNGEITGKQLFRKELTPSDVGKLNRLVIPKKFAVKYFPRLSDGGEQIEGGSGVQDTDLVFFDRSKRSWKFRYCYWKSSQSYVFTRGWNRFVKEKGLRPKDVVIFSLLESKERSNEAQNLCMLDVEYSDATTSGGAVVEDADHNDEELLLEMRLSYPHNISNHNQGMASSSRADLEQHVDEVEEENVYEPEKMCFGDEHDDEVEEENAYEPAEKKMCFGDEQVARENKGLRLFGVQIV